MQNIAGDPDGEEIYKIYCKSCHGKKGSFGFAGTPKLTKSKLLKEDRIIIITEGKGAMTPFGGLLSEEEIDAVAEFTLSFSK